MNYIIDCRHCGSHTEFYSALDRRSKRALLALQPIHVDTQSAIRCPVCRKRLNTSEEEFHAQVRMSVA